jgi:hypothetical protein
MGPHLGHRRRESPPPRGCAPRVPLRVESLEPRLLLTGPDPSPIGVLGGLASSHRVAIVQSLAVTTFPPPSGIEVGGQGSGLLVQEIPSPHDSPDTAQALLPDFADGGVTGTLRPGEAMDFYRIDVGADTVGVRLELTSLPDSGAARFQILDDSGEILVDQPVAGGSVATVVLTAGSGIARDPILYAAIFRSPGTETDPEVAVSYDLRAARLSTGDPADQDPARGPSPTDPSASDPSAGLVVLPALTNATTMPAEGADSGGADSPSAALPRMPGCDPCDELASPSPPARDPGPAEPVSAPATVPFRSALLAGAGPIATVPLPSSPSRPLGGVFGFGGPVPVFSGRDLTRVDRALIDVRPRGLPARLALPGGRGLVRAMRGDGEGLIPPRLGGAGSIRKIALEVLDGDGPGRAASTVDTARVVAGMAVRVEDVPALPLFGPRAAITSLVQADPEGALRVPGPDSGSPADPAAAGPANGEPGEGHRPRRDLPRAAARLAAHGSAALALGLLWGSDLAVARHRLARLRPRRRPVR